MSRVSWFLARNILFMGAASVSLMALNTAVSAKACPGNDNALGITRTIEVDTTGGPGFGLQQYKAYDFLKPGEVVLTFDDGPWPKNTPAVLEALAKHCTKATFFIIGKHAIAHPHILKKVAAAGHTVGSHTWSHANLARKKSLKSGKSIDEIEKGASAVKAALGEAPAAFFRFPFLQDPDEMVSYLGSRNMAIFSMDVDSFDFKQKNPKRLIEKVIAKLKKKGKGILLMHDFQKVTAKAMPALLDRLKAEGFKIVHMKAQARVTTLPKYDEQVSALLRGPMKNARPISSVLRTVPSE